MAKFNLKTAKIGFDFTKGSMQFLMMNGIGPVVSYSSSFKGKDYFSIRKLWLDENSGEWMPGKGLAVAPTEAAELCKAIGSLTVPKAVKPIKGKVGKGRAA